MSLALLESFKIQYLQFLAYTKTPQYKASLQQLLDQEKVRSTCICIPSALQSGKTAKPFTLYCWPSMAPAYKEHSELPAISPCPCSQVLPAVEGISGGIWSVGMLSPWAGATFR